MRFELWVLLLLIGCSVQRGAIAPGGGADAASSDGGGGLPDASAPRDAPLEGGSDGDAGTATDGGGDARDSSAADGRARDSSMPDTTVSPEFCDGSDPALRFCVRFEDALADEAPAAHPMRGSGHDFAAGRVGRALDHEPGDMVWLENTSDLESIPFTFEMWLRPASFPSSGRAGAADFNGSFGLFIYPGGDVACKGSDGARVIGGLTVGTWTHVACIFEPTRIRTFIDGIEAASISESNGGGSGGGDFRFGGNAPSGDDYDGLLDEARYFGDVRTASELAAAAAR